MFKHKNDIIIYTAVFFRLVVSLLCLSFAATVKTLTAFVVVKSYLKRIQNNTAEKT